MASGDPHARGSPVSQNRTALMSTWTAAMRSWPATACTWVTDMPQEHEDVGPDGALFDEDRLDEPEGEEEAPSSDPEQSEEAEEAEGADGSSSQAHRVASDPGDDDGDAGDSEDDEGDEVAGVGTSVKCFVFYTAPKVPAHSACNS